MSKTILIVDDSKTERVVLNGYLKSDYDVIEATGGMEAISVLNVKSAQLSAIVLDVLMPDMDGFEVLKKIRENSAFSRIPVVITTGLDDGDSREKAIACGADNFVTKPFNRHLLLHVLQNAIALRETAAIISTLRRDNLTGMLNRESFFAEAEQMIHRHNPGHYVLSCLDVENFKVINDQYGTDTGDEVLRHIAACLTGFAADNKSLACRYVADKFVVLYPLSKINSAEVAENHTQTITPKCLPLPIRIRVGRYTVNDLSLPVSSMYDRASMAENTVKGRYDAYIAEYTDVMRDALISEQQIVNDMSGALENGEFVPWFQPQYNHATGALIGAEALVRWRKNGKIVPPNTFIPVFERNGFIYEVDKAVWRQVCSLLRRWLDEGKNPPPVSVNISRFDLYQKDFLDVVCNMTAQFELPVQLLRLEITESAFAASTKTIFAVVNELIRRGFVVEIDDFGSGYSSLNILKDVPAAVLKLDMRFFEATENSQRGGNIVESVVRMAKWLGMAVIAEGVEEKAQADYLKTIGCYYIQGYFYARAMPVTDYEKLMNDSAAEHELSGLQTLENLDNNMFWDPKSMETLIFNSYVGGACIFEVNRGRFELLRVNDRYFTELNGLVCYNAELKNSGIFKFLSHKELAELKKTLHQADESKKEASCEVCLVNDAQTEYLRITVRVIARTNERILYYAVLYNMTKQRVAEKNALVASEHVKAIMNSSRCGITAFVISPDGNAECLFVNDRFYELLGYTQQQFRTEVRTPFDLLHPDDYAAVTAKTIGLQDVGQSAALNMRVLRRDKTVLHLRGDISIVRFADIEYPVQLANFLDITEQVEAEIKRSESAEQLRIIMANINGSVSAILMDDVGNTTLIFGNDRYYGIFGYTKQQAEEIRLDTMSCIHPEDFPKVVAKLNQLKLDGIPIDIIYRAQKRDGSLIYVRSVSSRMSMEGFGDRVIVSVETDITQQRTLEDQLRAVVENINGGVSATRLIDGIPEFVIVNDKYYELIGYTRAQFEAEVKNIFELVHPCDRERVEKLFKEAELSEKPYTMEYRVVKRNGAVRYILCNTNVMRFFGVDAPVQLAVSNDITQLREAQQKERDLSAQLNTIMKNIHGGVTATVFRESGEPEVIFTNDGFYEMYGYTKEQFDAEIPDLFSLIIDEDYKKAEQTAAGVLRERGNATYEFRCRKRDGSIVWTQVTNAVISIQGVGDTVLLSIATDVTPLHSARQHALDTTDRLQAVLNAMNSGVTAVAFYGSHTEFLFANEKYFTLHGITRELFTRYELREALAPVHPDDRGLLRDIVLNNTRPGQTAQAEYRIQRPDGTAGWIKAELHVSKFAGVSVPVQVTIYTDITEHKVADGQLRFLNSSARDISTQPDAELALKQTLDKINSYFEADRSYVVELDYSKHVSNNTCEVCAPGVRSVKDKLQTLAFSESERWYALLTTAGYIIIKDVGVLDDSEAELREMLSAQGIRSLIIVALKREGRLIGFAGADNPGNGIGQVEQLTALSDYITVLMTRRDLKRQIKHDGEIVRRLIDDTPGGFCCVRINHDAPPSLVTMNKGLCRMLGMTETEAKAAYGENVLLCLESCDIETVRAASSEALRSSGQFSSKCRLRRRNGELLWVSVFGRFSAHDGGEVFLNVYFSDITADINAGQRRAELLDNLPCGAAMFNFDTERLRLIYTNSQYMRSVSRGLKDCFDNISDRDYLHPDDRKLLLEEIRNAVADDRNAECEIRLLCGTEEYRTFRINANITENTDGTYLLFVPYIRMTEHDAAFSSMLPQIFGALTESSSELAFVKDVNFRYVCCSKAFAALCGLADAKEAVGKTDGELFSRAAAEMFRRGDTALLSSGMPQTDVEETLTASDGTAHRIITTKQLLHSASGEIAGIYCIGHDLTNKRRTQTELKLLADSISGGVASFLYCSDGLKYIHQSDGYCELLGYSQKEYAALHPTPFGFVFDEDRAAFDECLAELVKNGTPFVSELRVRTKDGGSKWVSFRAAMSERIKDDVIADVVLCDLSAEKESKERLLLAEKEYRLATAHTERTICRYDIASRTLTVSPDAASRLSLPESISDVPYKCVKLGMISPETEQAYIAFFESVIRGGTECKATFRERFNGTWRWLEARSAAVLDSYGKPVRAVISYTDITEQREKEAIFSRWQNSLAGRPEDSYTLFCCNLSKNASYDSRSGTLLEVEFPDNTVSFDEYTSIYINKCVYADDRDRYRAFMRADTMLAEYYRGHRSDSIDYREYDKNGCIRWLRLSVELVRYPESEDVEAFMMYESIDAQKRIQLHTVERAQTDPLTGVLNRSAFAVRVNQLISASGPDTRHALLMLDIDSFSQVNDIFGNGAGDRTLTDIADLLTRSSRKNDLIGRLGSDEFLVFLTDITNEAAAAKKARQLCELTCKDFNIRVRISSSIGAAMYPQDGEGFETLYKVANEMLSRVKDSGKNGYAFKSEQPVLSANASCIRQPAEETVAGKTLRRMLIVDDSAQDMAILEGLFRESFRIEKASDGMMALTKLRHYGTAISVVLLDLMMPGMDGCEVLSKMQRDDGMRTVPVIVVSADGHRDTALRVIKNGAVDLITKPVDPELLRIRVAAAVSRSENERLRTQSSYLTMRNTEFNSYKSALERSGIIVVSLDWVKNEFAYSPSVSERLYGVYDGENFWRVLLAEMVADAHTVQSMQQLVHTVAENRERTDGCMFARLRNSGGLYKMFEMNVFKELNDFGLTGKILITLREMNAAEQ